MRHRLSYASVTATLALFIAIGGTTAVGAQALLTGRAVKDETLTGADIQNDSLTGADVRSGSLGSNVFSNAARANLRGATGPAGPAGETGPAGPAGVGVTAATATGPDVTGYQDLEPLAQHQPAARRRLRGLRAHLRAQHRRERRQPQLRALHRPTASRAAAGPA